MPSSKCVSHFHITLEDCTVEQIQTAAKLIGGKVTSIDLVKGDTIVKDRMLTKWQKGSDLLETRQAVKLLTDSGYKVVRYKLERMIQHLEDISKFNITDTNYLEVHIKVPTSVARVEVFPFVMSSNSKDVDHYFYNSRARSNEQAKIIQNIIEERFKEYPSHIEYVVYDSNQQHDRWWA